MILNIKQLIKYYAGLWVALEQDTNKVLSKGSNIERVFKTAKEKGEKVPVLFKVPTKQTAYIG